MRCGRARGRAPGEEAAQDGRQQRRGAMVKKSCNNGERRMCARASGENRVANAWRWWTKQTRRNGGAVKGARQPMIDGESSKGRGWDPESRRPGAAVAASKQANKPIGASYQEPATERRRKGIWQRGAQKKGVGKGAVLDWRGPKRRRRKGRDAGCAAVDRERREGNREGGRVAHAPGGAAVVRCAAAQSEL